MQPYSVLIVEDETLIAQDLRRRLESWGCRVIEICDAAPVAIDLAKSLKPELIFMDIRLHGQISGLEAARVIQRDAPSRIIFLTANAQVLQPFIQDSWFKNCKVISKPASDEAIRQTIAEIFAN